MKKYDCIYFMGDSWTVAYGQSEDIHNEVTEHARWTTLVSNHFGLECYNRAIAGCGNYTILNRVFTDVKSLLDQQKNPFVVVSYTDPNRIELYNKELGNHSVINEGEWGSEFYKTFLTTCSVNLPNQYTAINFICAIQSFLLRYDIDFVDNFAFTEILKDKLVDPKYTLDKTLCEIATDEGRLLMPLGSYVTHGHANALGNKRIADRIINKITDLYSI